MREFLDKAKHNISKIVQYLFDKLLLNDYLMKFLQDFQRIQQKYCDWPIYLKNIDVNQLDDELTLL